jgi:hypothetical protein
MTSPTRSFSVVIFKSKHMQPESPQQLAMTKLNWYMSVTTGFNDFFQQEYVNWHFWKDEKDKDEKSVVVPQFVWSYLETIDKWVADKCAKGKWDETDDVPGAEDSRLDDDDCVHVSNNDSIQIHQPEPTEETENTNEEDEDEDAMTFSWEGAVQEWAQQMIHNDRELKTVKKMAAAKGTKT